MMEMRIAVAPSALLAVGLGATHFAAATLLWLVPLPAEGKAALTLAIAASLVYLLARNALLHAPDSIVGLEARDGTVLLQTRSGEWLEGDVLGSSYVSPRLTIVNFKLRGKRRVRHVILVVDNVDPREFRRFRTWLRWKQGETALDPA
jgi:hypothetical protein